MVFSKKLLVAGVVLTLVLVAFISIINRLPEEQEVTQRQLSLLLRNTDYTNPRTVIYKSDLSYFDKKSVEGKSFQDVDGLQKDGTYLLYHDDFHQGPTNFCMPMVEEQDRIKRVHYHFSYCYLFGETA